MMESREFQFHGGQREIPILYYVAGGRVENFDSPWYLERVENSDSVVAGERVEDSDFLVAGRSREIV